MERIAYRPLRGGPEVALLLTSFAVGQILQNGVLLLTRLRPSRSRSPSPRPEVLSGVVNVGLADHLQGEPGAASSWASRCSRC